MADRPSTVSLLWSQTRYQFQAPLAKNELVQERVARMEAWSYAADALGSGAAIKTLVTTHQCDRRTKEDTLKQSHKKIEVGNKLLAVVPIVMEINIQHTHAVKEATGDTHEVRHDR